MKRENELGGDKPERENMGVNGIADELLENAPNVSEHVIGQAEEEAITEEQNRPVSPAGETFDPIQHVSPDSITKAGYYRKKAGRPAAKNEASHKTSSLGGVGQSESIQAKSMPSMDSTVAGRAAAHLLIQCGVMFGGEEWQPMKVAEIGLDERAQIESAFIGYFEAKGITDFPPGVALAIAVGGYCLPRFTMPKTQSRFQRAVSWIQSKFGKKRANSEDKNAEPRK